jgi:hypothetical protein
MEGALQKPLEEAGYRKLKAAVEMLSYLTELVSNKATTLKRLRPLLGIESGKKMEAVLAQWRRRLVRSTELRQSLRSRRRR